MTDKNQKGTRFQVSINPQKTMLSNEEISITKDEIALKPWQYVIEGN